MRVRMLTSIAGPTLSAVAGQEVEFDDATAVRLLNSGQAEPVKQPVEAAIAPSSETATTPQASRPRPAGRK